MLIRRVERVAPAQEQRRAAPRSRRTAHLAATDGPARPAHCGPPWRSRGSSGRAGGRTGSRRGRGHAGGARCARPGWRSRGAVILPSGSSPMGAWPMLGAMSVLNQVMNAVMSSLTAPDRRLLRMLGSIHSGEQTSPSGNSIWPVARSSRTETAWATCSVTTQGIVRSERSCRGGRAFICCPDMTVRPSSWSRVMQPRRRLSASPVRTPDRYAVTRKQAVTTWRSRPTSSVAATGRERQVRSSTGLNRVTRRRFTLIGKSQEVTVSRRAGHRDR